MAAGHERFHANGILNIEVGPVKEDCFLTMDIFGEVLLPILTNLLQLKFY